MSETHRDDLASEFVVRWTGLLVDRVSPPRRALDLAMGRGRHAAVLAAAGFRVFGVDIKPDAVRDAVRLAAARGFTVHGWAADLTRTPVPRDCFDLVLVTRYLQRDLFRSIRAAVTRGGFVVYETFTEAQRALGRGPTSPEHLLKPGELRSQFAGFEVVFTRRCRSQKPSRASWRDVRSVRL